jgi:hypothetical protein
VPEYLLALDPSTDFTGAAFLEVSEDGSVRLLAVTSFDAFELACQPRSRTALKDRVGRMRETRVALSFWIGGLDNTPTALAYETQSGRGHASSEALVMAVGAYITLSRLDGLEPIEINRAAGCAAVGASGVYAQAAGKTSAERDAKRARLKAAVIAGVNRIMGLSLQADQDAEADAIAVGLAAAKKMAIMAKAKATKKTRLKK